MRTPIFSANQWNSFKEAGSHLFAKCDISHFIEKITPNSLVLSVLSIDRGTVPKGYPKRQKFSRDKNTSKTATSYTQKRATEYTSGKWAKCAISKYRGEMIAGRAARREELF